MSASGTRSAAFGATLALHALVLGALIAYAPAREALMNAVIIVEFIAPPRAEPKLEPPTVLPKPKPVARHAPQLPDPAPILIAPAEAPAAVAVAAPRPEAPAPVVAAAAPEPVAAPVTPPVFNADYLDNPPPSYPALSRRLGEQGRVVLRVLVNPVGRADEVQVRASSGHARLDAAARETVQRWKFVPARRGSEPVAAWVLIPISFKLEG